MESSSGDGPRGARMRAFWCAGVLADGPVAANAPVMVPRRQGRAPFWCSAAGTPCILVAALDAGAIMRNISAAAPERLGPRHQNARILVRWDSCEVRSLRFERTFRFVSCHEVRRSRRGRTFGHHSCHVRTRKRHSLPAHTQRAVCGFELECGRGRHASQNPPEGAQFRSGVLPFTR